MREKFKHTTYDLIANVVHDGKPQSSAHKGDLAVESSTYRVQVLHHVSHSNPQFRSGNTENVFRELASGSNSRTCMSRKSCHKQSHWQRATSRFGEWTLNGHGLRGWAKWVTSRRLPPRFHLLLLAYFPNKTHTLLLALILPNKSTNIFHFIHMCIASIKPSESLYLREPRTPRRFDNPPLG